MISPKKKKSDQSNKNSNKNSNKKSNKKKKKQTAKNSISFQPVTMTNSECKKASPQLPYSIHRLKEQPEESPLTQYQAKDSIKMKHEVNPVHRKTHSHFNFFNPSIISPEKYVKLNLFDEKRSSTSTDYY